MVVLNGMLSGLSTLLIAHPLELIWIKYTSDVTNQFSGVIDCIKQVYEVDGISGFYKGFGLAFLGAFAFRATLGTF